MHGIAVADPQLATLLRRAGAWAGPSKGGFRPAAFVAGLADLLDDATEDANGAPGP